MYIYTLLNHIWEVIRKKPLLFLGSLVFFLALYAFFFALFTIPLPTGELGFYRMEAPTQFDYLYLVTSSVLSSLIMTLTFHKIKLKVPKTQDSDDKKGKISSIFGFLTGIFGAVCPACLGINFLVFGNVFTAQLAFLIPYIVWIQTGGVFLLLLGLYFVAKSSFEKHCLSCKVDDECMTTPVQQVRLPASEAMPMALVTITLILVLFQVVSFWGDSVTSENGQSIITITANGRQTKKIDQVVQQAINEVNPPEGFKTKVKWNGVVTKMVEQGVLDPDKLAKVLKNKYGQEMKPEWQAVLDGEDRNLEINSDNAVFMMYMLWTLAKSNNNQILTDSPFGKYFKNYDIGVGKAGYGNVNLLSLTPEQQARAKKVAEASNRPCCGNSTARPDCSHGFSALGLVELMASQDFSEEEMLETFVQFNSYWFPQTYVKTAIYFNLTEGKSWDQVDKGLVASKQYSSLSGAYAVKNYLSENYGI